nr:SCO1664 family protein [Phytoactinopolyspora alkaliphila]
MLGLLANGDLAVEGRLVVASNVTLLGRVSHGEQHARCVYKPTAGERPLWDFPDATLANREVAAYLVSEAAGWHVVPPTVLRDDGPMGPGMCQAWIEQTESLSVLDSAELEIPLVGATDTPPWVDVVPPDRIPAGALPILQALDGDGSPVVLVHADHPGLRALALFDVVVNNADRKGGHILTGDREIAERMAGVVGVDHGVSFHEEPKLRTVLWGWAGQQLADHERAALARLRHSLDAELGESLMALLDEGEVAALKARIAELLQVGRMPEPQGRMPVPWPVF